MLRPYTSVIIHYFWDSDKREGVEERDSRSAGLRSSRTSDLGSRVRGRRTRVTGREACSSDLGRRHWDLR
jgi:hypothetical protein